MGRLFRLPPATAHSKKVSPPKSSIPPQQKRQRSRSQYSGNAAFSLIKTRQGESLSVDRTRRSPVSRPAISCDAS